MALIEDLLVGKLTVKKFTVSNPNSYFMIGAGSAAGVASTTYAASVAGEYRSTDILNMTGGTTMSAVTLDFASVAFTGRGQIAGVSAANTATTDFINYMAVRKNGVQRWKVIAAGTAAGTGATLAVTNTAVKATDLAFGTIRSLGTGSRTLGKIVCTANTVTITGSGAFTGSHSVDYVVVRPIEEVGTETHKIFTAGRYSTVGSSATESITGLAGVRATDVGLVEISGGATQTFLYAAPYTNGIAMEFSADPGATHTIDYIVFRKL
jgi:hypothetical protein